MEKEIDRFCRNYEAEVKADPRPHMRYPKTNYWEFPNRADVMKISYETYTVPRIQISMPEDRFRVLLEMEERIDKMMDDSKYERDWILTMMEKERKESIIRQTNPAVKKAYENYSLLLNMVKDHYK